MRGACPANTGERVGGNFRLVETDKSNQRIVGAEFQSTVNRTLLHTPSQEYRWLPNSVCHLLWPGFRCAVKQLNKKYVIVAYKCNHGTVRRKDGDLLRSTVRQPFNNVVCRNALIISFQRVNVMYSCVWMPIYRCRFSSNQQFLTVGRELVTVEVLEVTFACSAYIENHFYLSPVLKEYLMILRATAFICVCSVRHIRHVITPWIFSGRKRPEVISFKSSAFCPCAIPVRQKGRVIVMLIFFICFYNRFWF